MLYAVFVVAVVVTILFFTDPELLMRQKFRGKDFYEMLAVEEHDHTLKLLSRGIHAILYALVYYPVALIAVPTIILWAISEDVGLQIVSFIAATAVVAILCQFGYWFWKVVSGDNGKADILTDDGKRYRGKVISEEKVVKIDTIIRDVGGNFHFEGTLLDEDDDKVRVFTSEGVKIVYKNPYNLKHMDKENIIITEIKLKDGTRKTGRRTHIFGEKPFKEFLPNLPDLILVFYLWYLVVVLLTSF